MLSDVVNKYLKIFPEDKEQLGLLLDQIKRTEPLDNRRNFRGHIAGDAIILSPDLKKILFIYHLRSRNWQQPGGHWDDDEAGPWLTAQREAIEETGVKIARRINLRHDERIPLQIITGPVYPSREKREPHHWHHDFRYGFIAESEELGEIQDEGISEAKWVELNGIKTGGGHSIQTSIDRLQALL
jgi:8-oxo-dGTP pyrophosphatase MutT (NUDIX family)